MMFRFDFESIRARRAFKNGKELGARLALARVETFLNLQINIYKANSNHPAAKPALVELQYLKRQLEKIKREFE